MRLHQVVPDQRVIRIADREQTGRRDIDPERRWIPLRLGDRGRSRVLLRIVVLRHEQQHNRNRRGHTQPQKPLPILMPPGVNPRHHQRTQHRAHLVHRRVQTEAPTRTNRLRRVRQHHIARRSAHGFPYPLEHHKHRHGLPVGRERQQRHGDDIHAIAGNRQKPILARLVGQHSRGQPQPKPKQFPNARDETHSGCRSTQQRQKRTVDGTRAFVRHIRKKADEAEENDDPSSRRPIQCQVSWPPRCCSVLCLIWIPAEL